MLEHIDWDDVLLDLQSTEIPHKVIDNFLAPELAVALHHELMSSQMWRTKNPVSRHLHNAQPRTPTAISLVQALDKDVSIRLGEETQVRDYWSLLYTKNTDGNVHADFGDLTLTYWLTPNRHNTSTETGGLILYDVVRPPELPVNRYLTAGSESIEYVKTRTEGKHVTIPYAWNRAVIFDSRHFHKSDSPSFKLDNIECMRMSFTCTFYRNGEMTRQLDQIVSR